MKAVILAGGGGTRLWPLSTPEKPKQFQRLISNRTMLEETVNRLDFLKPKDIFIAINKLHLNLVKKLCPEIPEENIIIEPALRDTASCIGLAATVIEQRFPDEVMAVIYADHLIKNKKEFQAKLKLAEKIAQEQNTLNIIEVEATEPNTNYGYVKLGELKDKIEETEIYELDKFVEKPHYQRAKRFLASGKYLWNTGIYVWKASRLLEKYKKYQPETYEHLQEIKASLQKSDSEKTIKKIYPKLKKVSIDYAIMERVDTTKVRIIKANLGWSDVGTWEAIWGELSDQEQENIVRGNTKLLDCEGCLVYSDDDKEVVGINLKDLIVVDTKEGILIVPKKFSKRIKELH